MSTLWEYINGMFFLTNFIPIGFICSSLWASLTVTGVKCTEFQMQLEGHHL